jgi:glycosyltransferase involved in cell wall biosynthesis
VYNGARYIADAIRSVLRQSFERWSMVICDNNSSDGTRDVVRPFLEDSRISFLPSPSNAGMAANYTRCLNCVKTPYFMILCHDDFLWTRESLARAYHVVEGDPNVLAVYSDLMWVDQNGRPLARRHYGDSGFLNAARLARQSILRARNLFGIPLFVQTKAAAGLTFDPTLPYIIDLDFSVALCGRGNASMYRIPENLIAYRYDGSNATAALLSSDVSGQLVRMADKHRIALSPLDRTRTRVNASKAALLKQCFGFYVKRFRR